jgi:hypothetical protein
MNHGFERMVKGILQQGTVIAMEINWLIEVEAGETRIGMIGW